MTGMTTTLSLPLGLELLERAVAYTRGSLALVGPERYDAPTPCDRWRVRDLLVHMSDSLVALREAGATGRLGIEAYPDPTLPSTPSPDLLDAIRSQACTLLGAWTRDSGSGLVLVAGSPLGASVIAGAGALEIAVHGWDLAQGCGSPRPLAADFAGELLQVAVQLVDDSDRPARFGPVRAAPPAASAPQRLLAFLGR